MTLSELAAQLGGKLVGPANVKIYGPAKIQHAKEGEITFLSNIKYKHFLSTTAASAVIVDKEYPEISTPYILVPNAYAAFVMVLRLFEKPIHQWIQGISEQAHIHPTASVDATARVAAGVFIGPNAKVGPGTILYPGVVLSEGAEVGANCLVYANVSVRENCRVGNRVILQNGCVIGSDGFGFAPYEGHYEKIPQIGIVVLEDDVEIGANTTIDRATLGETRIKQGTKLDNLVQIAHNVQVGQHTVIVSQAGIAGSTEIGDHVTIGGQAAVVGHVKVADGTILAARGGISKDTEPKSILWGAPAIPLMQQKRIEASMRRLPDLMKRIKNLEKQLANLTKEQK